jgi:hypothetical protein
MFPGDVVCLRNISVDTVHKGDPKDNNNNNNNNTHFNHKTDQPSTKKAKAKELSEVVNSTRMCGVITQKRISQKTLLRL